MNAAERRSIIYATAMVVPAFNVDFIRPSNSISTRMREPIPEPRPCLEILQIPNFDASIIWIFF